MNRHARGFTLLEVLVALVVVGILVVGLTQGIRFGITAWNTQHRLLAKGDGLDAIDRALRRMITLMQPGGLERAPSVVGSADRLAFITRLPIAAGSGGLRTASVVLSLDDAHHLVLQWTPDPHATPLVPPPRHRVLLLSDVARLEISYWLPLTHGGAWVTRWNRPFLPALVRLRILFRHRDPRIWPDIVARPILERAAG